MSVGRPLGAKLFLEGMEVPFIGATFTHTVNQASIAYIDLVPHKTINNIRPRTLATLMVRDYNDEKNGFPYVLAFEGEVFGYNFGKTVSSRTFSISCIDKTGYWDNVLTYFFNAQQSGSKGAGLISREGMDQRDAQALGARVQAVTHSKSSFFLNTIKTALNGPNVTDPDGTSRKADFLDAFVAVYREISKLNDFYKSAEERLRIVDRVLLKSSGDLATLLKENEALDWFGGVIGQESGLSTLRMVIQDLMSLIFHDFVSVPFPSKVPRAGLQNGITATDAVQRTVGEFIFKPNLYMVPPPVCNIFFPDEYSTFNFSRNFFQEITRLIYQPEIPRGFGGGEVALPHVYQPESFNHYMLGKGGYQENDLMGDGALQVNEDFGHFGDRITSEIQNDKREAQFLTNEEKMKGILTAKEGMVPASTAFRQALSDVGKRDFSEGVARYLFFKKRFEGRSIQITSQLKLSVVPGFNTLILDDSDAEQTVVAYCSSVTHRIFATQGGYTNTTLSYARTVEEQDVASGKAGEPLIPPWFSKEVFGEVKDPAPDAPKEVKDRGKQLIVDPKKLSEFYSGLIGDKGSKVINDLTGKNTLTEAAKELLKRYRSSRENKSVPAFISKTTSRDYVRARESFQFLGATTTTKDLSSADFIEFTGKRISGADSGQLDSDQVKARRAVIIAYRKALRANRGFRG